MKQTVLPRPFIYREREDIDEFLDESKLWRDLYDVFLQVRDNVYHLKVPAVKMFNEVRYQCVRLMLDKHPEEDIWSNYLNNAKDTLGWRYASDLCFSMVYAVLSVLKDPPCHVQRFCKILSDGKFKDEEAYFPHFAGLVRLQKILNNSYEIDLTPCPERPQKIRDAIMVFPTGKEFYVYDAIWWKEQTHDFDQDYIRFIIDQWQSKEDKLEMLSVIEENFNESVDSERGLYDIF